uniref:Uncharacterized protein n=1 Tax=viral metagenome TaxID=1070528 RepID=A0A6C0KLH8_9ZZZZ
MSASTVKEGAGTHMATVGMKDMTKKRVNGATIVLINLPFQRLTPYAICCITEVGTR